MVGLNSEHALSPSTAGQGGSHCYLHNHKNDSKKHKNTKEKQKEGEEGEKEEGQEGEEEVTDKHDKDEGIILRIFK